MKTVTFYGVLIGCLITFLIVIKLYEDEGSLRLSDGSWQKEGTYVRETFYSELQNINLTVIDSFFPNKAHRSIKMDDFGGRVTLVALKNVSNTIVIDKTNVQAGYYHAMLRAPFMANPNLRDYDSNMSVLSLGLGGGAEINFLSSLPNPPKLTTIELDPTMKKIAIKWFGVIETERNRIIIQDAADFIAKTNETFDLIMLDACSPHYSKLGFMCPAPVFITNKLLFHLSSKLTNNGVVAVNVALEHPNTPQMPLRFLMKKYSKYFKACVTLKAMWNYVIVCSKKATYETMKAFDTRLETQLSPHLKPLLYKKTNVYDFK